MIFKRGYALISMCRDGGIEASADALAAIRDWHAETQEIDDATPRWKENMMNQDYEYAKGVSIDEKVLHSVAYICVWVRLLSHKRVR